MMRDIDLAMIWLIVITGSMMALGAVFGPEPKLVEQAQPLTDCVDGILQQWDGEAWYPVHIRKTTRTIPCPFPET